MHQLRSRVRRWWTEKPRQIRLLTTVLMPIGFAFFLGGLRLDAIDWWTGHDYVLNVYSGLTGACFGVPVALLLLNGLANAQEEARQAARALERAGQEAAAFQQALLSLFAAPDLADLTARTAALDAQISALRFQRGSDPDEPQAMRSFLAGFDALLPSESGRPRRHIGALQNNSAEWGPVSMWRTGIRTQWAILHTEVRPALPGDGWIPEAAATAAQQATEQLLREGRNPWRRSGPERGGVTAMAYFIRDLHMLCQTAAALEMYK
ncbi:hypothetical protein [Streptomyces mirabilis]|uniref:hypothetical protein n=1 Tax=Streptomyces mirabilis TaxID=68239 RepID=UPI0036A5199B